MSDGLQTTLGELLRSGTTTNAALNRLIGDYAAYHLVLVLEGSLFALGLATLAGSSWRRVRGLHPGSGWSFERKTTLCSAVASTVLAAMLMVLVAANLSNVMHPRQGLAGTLSVIESSQPGSRQEVLHQEFATWLESGDAAVPASIQTSVDHRLAWQQPKAAICALLLIATSALAARVWRALIRRSRRAEWRWGTANRLLFVAGTAAAAACPLLMAMAIGNTQASFAPISLTMLYG